MQQVASDFIIAYYTLVIDENKRKNIVNFYDNEAYIWRAEMNSKVGSPINKASDTIFPPLNSEDVVIEGFGIIPTTNGFSLSVQGKLQNPNYYKVFSQFFTIQLKQKRYFIVADSLTVFNEISTVPTPILSQNLISNTNVQDQKPQVQNENANTEHQKPKYSQKSRKNPFAPWVPSQ